MWMKRNLSKGLEYRVRNTLINISRCSSSGFTICLYPEFPSRDKNIRIIVGFAGRNVIFNDLLGNSKESGYQDRHYGTLLVNLAIRVIKCWFNNDEEVKVSGSVSDQSDSTDRKKCRERRNSFWHSFGFKLNDMKAGCTPMSAKLGGLKIKERPSIDGYLSTDLKLSTFWRYFNRPTLLPHILECINTIDTDKYKPRSILSYDEIREKFNKAVNVQDKIINRIFMASFLVLTAMVYDFLDINLFPKIDFSLGFLQSVYPIVILSVVLFVINTIIKTHIFKIMPYYRTYNLNLETRKLQLKQLSNKINDLEIQYGGFIWQLYESLKVIDTSLDCKDFNLVSKASQEMILGADDVEEYGNMLEKLKESIQSEGHLSVPCTIDINNDFLFGDISTGLSFRNINEYCQLLDKKKFSEHIMRLLKKCDENRLIVEGGSSTDDISGIVKALKDDISIVELYTPQEPYTPMNQLHIRLYLLEGVIDLRSPWCAWKDIRAMELLKVLGVLLECELIPVTYIFEDKSGLGYKTKLFVPTNPEELILEVFDFINERWILTADLEDYCRRLTNTDVMDLAAE
ncbi:MAG: hypothetical protein V7765_04115 [Oleispira sp.]